MCCEGWRSLSRQQRRFGSGAGLALALLALGIAVPLLRRETAPRVAAPGIESARTAQVEAPTSVLPRIVRPAPSTRPGSIVTLPIKLGALVSGLREAWLGLKATPVNPSMAKSFGLLSNNGVFVEDAGPEGAIWQGGGRAGDVILSIDGRELAAPADLRARIQSMAPGERVTLEVWRFGTGPQPFKDMLLDLAGRGDGHAMTWLGVYSFGSTILPHDDKRALDWLAKGAEAGDVDAMFNLGNTLASGVRAKKDLAKAASRLGEAALGGHQPAAARLSDALAELNNTHANAARQAAVLRKLADLATLRPCAFWAGGMPRDTACPRASPKPCGGISAPPSTATPTPIPTLDGCIFKATASKRTMPRPSATSVWPSPSEASRPCASSHGTSTTASASSDAIQRWQRGALLPGICVGGCRCLEAPVFRPSENGASDCRSGMQRRLRDAGFYSGAIDGSSNEATVAALKALHNAQPRVAANM